MSPITALVSNSEIKIDLPGINELEMAKIQDCIVRLLNEKFFNIESGKIILHFQEGNLREIWTVQRKWKRKTTR
jgi:hypothetical protein